MHILCTLETLTRWLGSLTQILQQCKTKSHMTVFCLKLQATIGAHIENIVTTTLYQGRSRSLRLGSNTHVLKACNMIQIASFNIKVYHTWHHSSCVCKDDLCCYVSSCINVDTLHDFDYFLHMYFNWLDGVLLLLLLLLTTTTTTLCQWKLVLP